MDRGWAAIAKAASSYPLHARLAFAEEKKIENHVVWEKEKEKRWVI
jgi:hypothetical protein